LDAFARKSDPVHFRSRSLEITEVMIFYSPKAQYLRGARRDSVSVEYQGEFPGPKEKATR
jgi:hypothetical protein